MTLVVTTAALGLAYLYWLTVGTALLPGVSVFEAAYAAGVLTAVFFALRSAERHTIIAAIVLAANWGASLFAWGLTDVVVFTVTVDLLTATYFALRGQTRWELGLGALFGLSALVGVLTWVDLVPLDYGGSFVEWTFPSLTGVLGHLANVTLGMGAGDAGRRVRRVLGVRPAMDSVGGPLLRRRSARGEVVASEAETD